MNLLVATALVSQLSLCSSFMVKKSSNSFSMKSDLTRMSASSEAQYALLFDCDGVIVETEVSRGCNSNLSKCWESCHLCFKSCSMYWHTADLRAVVWTVIEATCVTATNYRNNDWNNWYYWYKDVCSHSSDWMYCCVAAQFTVTIEHIWRHQCILLYHTAL